VVAVGAVVGRSPGVKLPHEITSSETKRPAAIANLALRAGVDVCLDVRS
jgi:hypothetical protein